MSEQFSLYGPPRSVPLWVWVRLLLGGFSNQFGWLFFGFGLIFVWVMGGSHLLYNLVFFSGELDIVEGSITEVVETNVSINEETVYDYRYSYIVNDRRFEGNSKAFYGEYVAGDQATIEYSVTNPARSRAVGLSTESVGMWLVALFPAVGLMFMIFGLAKGVKGGRLLRHGRQTTGTLVSREATNATVNDETVYKFTFRFKTDVGQTHTVTAKTHVTDRFAGEPALTTFENRHDIQEPLLYNPANPADAVLLDDLPGSPRINQFGDIEPNSCGLFLVLIVPAITVVGHGWWLINLLELI